MTNMYYKDFIKFWLPRYKKMYFKAILLKDNKTIRVLNENVFNNWNLTNKQKEEIWGKITGKGGE